MKRFHILTLLLLMTGMASLQAEEASSTTITTTNLPESEWYLGVLAARNHIGGDFDGNRMYTNNTAVAVVPELDDAWGGGICGGIKTRLEPKVALGIEGSFTHSQHDAVWAGVPFKADHDAVALDFKLYFRADQYLQPFVQAGVNFPTIKVHDGWTDGIHIKDVSYTGLGFGGGAGILFYFNPRISFQLAGIYHRVKYDRIDYGDQAKIKPELSNDELAMNVGLNIHFKIR